MPRYFFDIHDGEHKAHDDVGIDCPSPRSATVQAIIALTELARETLPAAGPSRHLEIAVRTRTELLTFARASEPRATGPGLLSSGGRGHFRRWSNSRMAGTMYLLRLVAAAMFYPCSACVPHSIALT